MNNLIDIDTYKVLKTIASTYFSVHVIDLVHDTFVEYKSHEEIDGFMNGCENAAATMRAIMESTVADDDKERVLEFSDLRTIGQRLKGRTVLIDEFVCKNIGWVKEKFVVMEKDEQDNPTTIIHIIIEIGEQKRREELLQRLSHRDALTNCLNRLAYNEATAALNKDIPENLVYMTFDLNCLKFVNDRFGHNAGDELIKGAADCLLKELGPYGKVYRTGGDEFIAIVTIKHEDVESIIASLDTRIAAWQGTTVKELNISYGYACTAEHPDLPIDKLARISETNMYNAKNEFYIRKGIDRRGPRRE